MGYLIIQIYLDQIYPYILLAFPLIRDTQAFSLKIHYRLNIKPYYYMFMYTKDAPKL